MFSSSEFISKVKSQVDQVSNPHSILVLALLFLASLPQLVQAKGTTFRSGSYAHRAKIQWKEGNYTAGYALYRNALSESIKEANLTSEGFIKLNMANMEMDAMRFEVSQEFIEAIPPFHESKGLRFQTLILKMQLQQLQGNCQEAAQKLTAYMRENRENEEIKIRSARVPLAICFTSLGQTKKANNQLKWAEEDYEEGAKGMRAYGRAWVNMHDNKWTDAIKELHTAFDHAQSAVRPYDLGYILYYIGYCYEKLGETSMAAQFYKRSFQVYQKIQLARPTMRSLKRFLDIRDNAKLRKSLVTLEGQQQPSDLDVIYQEPSF